MFSELQAQVGRLWCSGKGLEVAPPSCLLPGPLLPLCPLAKLHFCLPIALVHTVLSFWNLTPRQAPTFWLKGTMLSPGTGHHWHSQASPPLHQRPHLPSSHNVHLTCFMSHTLMGVV